MWDWFIDTASDIGSSLTGMASTVNKGIDNYAPLIGLASTALKAKGKYDEGKVYKGLLDLQKQQVATTEAERQRAIGDQATARQSADAAYIDAFKKKDYGQGLGYVSV